MDENKKLAELIELHLELKAKDTGAAAAEPSIESEVPEEEGTLPPRKMLFPSNRKKLTQWFYNTLFTIFVLLVVGLLVWGIRLNDG